MKLGTKTVSLEKKFKLKFQCFGFSFFNFFKKLKPKANFHYKKNYHLQLAFVIEKCHLCWMNSGGQAIVDQMIKKIQVTPKT